MSVIKFARLAFPNRSDQEALKDYVLSKDAKLDEDVRQRLYGIPNRTGKGKTRVGYKLLREFFEGDQWLEDKEDQGSLRVHNFLRMTAINYSAFLSSEPPEVDVPPRDATDDLEIARVKEAEGFLKDVHNDNGFGDQFETLTLQGSALGDSILLGPFYDKENDKITYMAMRRPERVRVIWEDENYTKPMGYILHFRMTQEKAVEIYGADAMKAASTPTFAEGLTTDDTTRNRAEELVEIRMFVDDTYSFDLISSTQHNFLKHDLGFVSIIHVPNMPSLTSPWGTSDLEDMLDPQTEYNEATANLADILEHVAFPTIFGKNLDVEEIEAGAAKMYEMGDESDIFADPRSTNGSLLVAFMNGRKADVTASSGLNELFTGGSGKVFQATGRALSVLMQPITNRVQSRQRRWTAALQQLNKNILILAEKVMPEAKNLIDGHYDTDIFFSSTLVRDVTDELNKFIQKVQSQYTTMKNIGIPSPKDEQELMRTELDDERLMIEISRSPQLQLQLQQILQQAQQPQQSGAVKERQKNAAGPTLTEGENTGDEVPSAAGVPAQAPIPAEALAALQAAKGGVPALTPNP